MSDPEWPGKVYDNREREKADSFCQDFQNALSLATRAAYAADLSECLQRIAAATTDQNSQYSHNLAAQSAYITGLSERLQRRAAETATSIYQRSFFGALKFRLRVVIPEGTRAQTSISLDPIHEVREFEATDIRYIGPGDYGPQVDFYDVSNIKEPWITVFGYQMEVTPIMGDEQSPTSAE